MTDHGTDQGRLSRGLQEQVDRMPAGTSIGLDDVKRSARGIRRRRRIATGLAAAAVLAVAVPVGIRAATVDQGTRPVAPATTSPSPATPSPTPSAPRPQGVAALSVAQAPAGDPPKVDYLQGRTLHRSDGTMVQLDAAYTTVTPFRGGWLAVEPSASGGFDVVVLDNTGAEVSREPGSSQVAVSGDLLEVAWLTTDTSGGNGVLHHALTNGHSDLVDDQPVPDFTSGPVGFVGPGQVAYGVDGQTSTVRATDFHGNDRAVRGLLKVGGALGNGLLTGMTSSTGSGSCWVMRAFDTGANLWRTCDFSLGQFSPDGKYVIGYAAYRDGQFDTETAVLDAATGDPVAHWRIPLTAKAGGIRSVVWEDGTHLAATVYEDGAWSIVRLGTDGSVAEAAGPVRASADTPVFDFTPHP